MASTLYLMREMASGMSKIFELHNIIIDNTVTINVCYIYGDDEENNTIHM